MKIKEEKKTGGIIVAAGKMLKRGELHPLFKIGSMKKYQQFEQNVRQYAKDEFDRLF